MSCPDAGLGDVLQKTTASGIYVYGQGAILSSEAFVWDEDGQNDLGTSSGSQDPWAKTCIEVRNEVVRMQTGALNDPPLYMIQNTATRAWAVGTDVFTLNLVRAQWGCQSASWTPPSSAGTA